MLLSPVLTLDNTTFRMEYQVPENTFQDAEDGNTRQLSLYLYDSAGNELPKSSWVSLKNPQQIVNIYSSKAIFDLQPSGGFTFRLSAIDSSGTENHTPLKVNFNGPIAAPNYQRHLVSVPILVCLKNLQ